VQGPGLPRVPPQGRRAREVRSRQPLVALRPLMGSANAGGDTDVEISNSQESHSPLPRDVWVTDFDDYVWRESRSVGKVCANQSWVDERRLRKLAPVTGSKQMQAQGRQIPGRKQFVEPGTVQGGRNRLCLHDAYGKQKPFANRRDRKGLNQWISP